VLKLVAGANILPALPFSSLRSSVGVAADAAGDVYVADEFNNRVTRLPAGSSTPSVVPFTNLSLPTRVAVDTAGDVTNWTR
jgi:serine/threonine-protein kinase